MASDNKNTHLTANERVIIQTGIENGSSKIAIANTIGKDPSTVGKEIKLHRTLKKRSNHFQDCCLYKTCKDKQNCKGTKCANYKLFTCKRRDRSPGACNGCSNVQSCRYDKFYYNALDSHKEYRDNLVGCRQGINMTLEEFKEMANIIVPLIKQGQSFYQILVNHPEIKVCEKSLYNYVEEGLFTDFGLINVDLPDKVKRKVPKKLSNTYKKRNDYSYLKGRTYEDYDDYIKENPNAKVVQMDTVYNDISSGPFMQTFVFLAYGFTFAIYHNSKESIDMKNGVDLLYEILGKELFEKEVEVLLTDRGTEFVNADGMEKDGEDNLRTRVYYCDPMASRQKGKLENKHHEYRDILPKETDLHALGLNGQEDLNIVLSNINSTPLESLNGKTAIEVLRFYNPKLLDKFIAFGIKEIEKDMVVRKPYLLKKI